jgi:hypothetical protein
MPDDAEKLTPADASDIADSIAFALMFSGLLSRRPASRAPPSYKALRA